MLLTRLTYLMRAKQFVPIVEAQQELFEINMSPGNLKKLAGGIDAKIGFEFEMIVPDIGNVEDYEGGEPDYDAEPEEDMDYDESVRDIDDILSFFSYEDANYGDTIRELEEELRERFYEWQSEQINEQWNSSDGREFFAEWCRNNVSDDEVADHVDKEEDESGEREPSKEDWEKFIEDEWEESYNSDNYQNAYDEFFEDRQSYGDFDEGEFLNDIGIRYMSQVNNNISSYVSWPHMIYPTLPSISPEFEELADDFSNAVGLRANPNPKYQGGDRNDDEYDIEPDSSLEPGTWEKNSDGRWERVDRGGPDDYGLEFVSPPLPLETAFEQLRKVKKWADSRKVYTNKTTGLHTNVSISGYDPNKLDFVKLTLLLGDKYLTDQFGRTGEYYCKSAFEIIKEAPSAQDKELLFKKLKDNLETIASRVIHSGSVTKFTSINPKNNRVEFRGPGGDWLGKSFNKIEDTVYRCVVALEAAVDPEKYRKEYLKKLTELFAPGGEKKVKYYDPNDPRNRMQGGAGPGTGATKSVPTVFTQKGPGTRAFIEPGGSSIETVFVKYMAGIITSSELKAELSNIQGNRKKEKLSKEGVVELEFYEAKEGDWIIEYDNPNGDNRRIFLKKTEQVSDDNQALNAAINLKPTWFKPDDIENIIVTEYTDKKVYNVFDKEGNIVGNYNAITPLQAIDITMSYDDSLPKNELTAKLASESEPEPLRMAPDESEFVIINNTLNQQVSLGARDSATALSRALRNNPSWDSYQHAIRVLSASPQTQEEEPYKLYRVRGNQDSRYISARTVGEAGRIAITVYPELGDTVDSLDIVLQDAYPEVIDSYLRSQQADLENRNNQSSGNGLTSGQPGEGERYIVRQSDGSGSVVVRGTSPENAIERARAAFNISADRELEANLYV